MCGFKTRPRYDYRIRFRSFPKFFASRSRLCHLNLVHEVGDFDDLRCSFPNLHTLEMNCRGFRLPELALFVLVCPKLKSLRLSGEISSVFDIAPNFDCFSKLTTLALSFFGLSDRGRMAVLNGLPPTLIELRDDYSFSVEHALSRECICLFCWRFRRIALTGYNKVRTDEMLSGCCCLSLFWHLIAFEKMSVNG